jgi:hypothetical protein
LRAKARHEHWSEEITILTHEMNWTELWFQHPVQVWEQRRLVASLNQSQGHQVYAAKQVWVWTKFLGDANVSFMEVVHKNQL